jgi:biopolymer transport protein ExbD
MMLTKREKSVLSELQRHHDGAVPASNEFALGKILVASGEITREQLHSALSGQRTSGLRIGEALIEAGHATKAQVDVGLVLQSKFIAYALALATGLAPISSLVPSAEAAQSNGAMQVSVTVIAGAKLQTIYQAKHIEISAADVARGQVEVPAALRFSVAISKGAGYLMQFHPIGNIFDSVYVDGMGNSVRLGADGGAIIQRVPQVSNQMHELGFRFILNPGTTPGIYPWPLDLTVRAL